MQCACALLSSVARPAVQYFSKLSHKRRVFRKKKIIEHKMCVMIFCTTFVRNISHSNTNWARCDQKRTSVFTYGARYYCQISMKLKFSRHRFEKYSNTKFHENPSSGSRGVPSGRTDRHDDANSRFRNSENASKNFTHSPHCIYIYLRTNSDFFPHTTHTVWFL